ncbi:MAG: ABC transporter ATP-binding protein [Ruminiclostridium sp.]
MRIRLNNITKSYGKKAVIRPASITIDSGSFTTLLGPSGCGKTTLLRMLSGLETPDSGEIFFDDRCVFSSEKSINIPPEKRGLGFVFQDFALWPHMTVYENVAFGLRASRRTENLDEKVKNALRAVRLEDFAARYPSQLSGGQQQRVAFARAIVIEPECILFDEPLSALDALLREEMRTELKELISRLGITAVFVTHDQTEAMSMSDKIAVLDGGVIQQYASPEEIYSKPATPFVAKFIGSSNWVDERKMFRPEKAKFSADGEADRFTAEAVSVQFLGENYRVQLKYGENLWTFLSADRMQVGTKVSIYIKQSDMITF